MHFAVPTYSFSVCLSVPPPPLTLYSGPHSAQPNGVWVVVLILLAIVCIPSLMRGEEAARAHTFVTPCSCVWGFLG